MKTKPIEWRKGVHSLHLVAFCGDVKIGSYIITAKTKAWAKSLFFKGNSIEGDEKWFESVEEARAWVESQFQNFITEISA